MCRGSKHALGYILTEPEVILDGASLEFLTGQSAKDAASRERAFSISPGALPRRFDTGRSAGGPSRPEAALWFSCPRAVPLLAG